MILTSCVQGVTKRFCFQIFASVPKKKTFHQSDFCLFWVSLKYSSSAWTCSPGNWNKPIFENRIGKMPFSKGALNQNSCGRGRKKRQTSFPGSSSTGSSSGSSGSQSPESVHPGGSGGDQELDGDERFFLPSGGSCTCSGRRKRQAPAEADINNRKHSCNFFLQTFTFCAQVLWFGPPAQLRRQCSPLWQLLLWKL